MDNEGKRLREFDTVEEMDELMVERWNSVVHPQDKVYHLGDVVMHKRALPILARLNGEKFLLKEITTRKNFLCIRRILRTFVVHISLMG